MSGSIVLLLNSIMVNGWYWFALYCTVSMICIILFYIVLQYFVMYYTIICVLLKSSTMRWFGRVRMETSLARTLTSVASTTPYMATRKKSDIKQYLANTYTVHIQYTANTNTKTNIVYWKYKYNYSTAASGKKSDHRVITLWPTPHVTQSRQKPNIFRVHFFLLQRLHKIVYGFWKQKLCILTKKQVLILGQTYTISSPREAMIYDK